MNEKMKQAMDEWLGNNGNEFNEYDFAAGYKAGAENANKLLEEAMAVLTAVIDDVGLFSLEQERMGNKAIAGPMIKKIKEFLSE